MIAIIDYGMGNLKSIQRALVELNAEVTISNDPRTIAEADRLVLPGVGAFADGMKNLTSLNLDKIIKELTVRKKRPLLGICLGMQLMATKGNEGGRYQGLGIIPGEVKRLEPTAKNERIPHVGWNEVHLLRPSALFMKIPDDSDFYFVHSYHLIPESKEVVVGTTDYCDGFASVVNSGNIWGVQFHPEKSGSLGAAVLRNFIAF